MGEIRSWLRERANEDLTLAFAAGAALLFASLANFLSYNDYPYLRLEVGLVSLGIVALAILMAKFYLPQRQWGRSVLEGLLAAFFVDLNTESVLLIFVAGVGVSAITAWRRISLLGPMAVFGFVVFLTTLGGIGGRSSWINTIDGERMNRTADGSGKPAIVHIILDEHIGIEGLAHEGADGKQLRDELKRFYLTSGFAVYGGAYSEHYRTINALPHILNYGDGLGRAATKAGVRAGSTKHLQALQAFRLVIFQSEFANFCADAAFDQCVTYDSAALRPTLALPMPTAERAGLLVLKILTISDIFGALSEAWNTGAIAFRRMGWRFPVYDVNIAYSSTMGALAAADALSERLVAARPGDAFFAHLLLPHFPYVVRGDCSYLPWRSWDGLESDSTIDVRRRAYYEQLRCTIRKVDYLLQALSRSPAGANSVVIIHGDHGSRIVRVPPNAENFGRIRDTDLIAGFSTLFAIRTPNSYPRYFQEGEPVAELLREFKALKFVAAPHPKPSSQESVYLADSDWRPVRRVQLPKSWTKGVDRPALGH